jgi:UDP-N-acetylmuramoylalanine--D-glutamate ligase
MWSGNSEITLMIKKKFHNVVIVGLGKTGLSCVNFCKRQGWPISITDSRINPPGADQIKQNIPTAFGEISAKFINNADLLIVSPGVSLKEPVIANAIKNGIPYVGDIELFAQSTQTPIIAITGSNAKSTVTTLVGEMARYAKINVQVGGNIGTPALDLPAADLYVLELSSFQLETAFSLRAKVAAVLNVCEDHMDRYHNLQEYTAAKIKIYQNCEIAVINRAEKSTKNLKLNSIISFGLDAPEKNQYGIIKHDNEKYLAKGKQLLLNTKKLKLIGQHNLENALAALAIGDAAGFDQKLMLKALQEFPGLPHRCQLVRTINNAAWYNDSKGTNVGATLAALSGLGQNISGKIILIAGGLGKNADFTPLQSAAKKYIRQAILIGKAADVLKKTLQNSCTTKIADDLQQAVQLAYDAAMPNDIILLSPACASFDMFNDYQHRGNEFIKIVKEL